MCVDGSPWDPWVTGFTGGVAQTTPRLPANVQPWVQLTAKQPGQVQFGVLHRTASSHLLRHVPQSSLSQSQSLALRRSYSRPTTWRRKGREPKQNPGAMSLVPLVWRSVHFNGRACQQEPTSIERELYVCILVLTIPCRPPHKVLADAPRGGGGGSNELRCKHYLHATLKLLAFG